MGFKEKSQFISASMEELINDSVNLFRETNKDMIESNLDPNGIANVLRASASLSMSALNEWENISFPQLDGMTPKQFFDSLNSIDEIIEMVSLIDSKCGGLLPTGLCIRIMGLDKSLQDDLLAVLSSINEKKNKSLSPEQAAAVHVAGILLLPQYIDILVGIISHLDINACNQSTFIMLMDIIRNIGEPALDTLVKMIEDADVNDNKYRYLLITTAKIASNKKSEQVFNLLKDCFRKSESKLAEATALSVYGDGRAIPAIRGYVEKNINKLSLWEYSQFRESILILGGSMGDLDYYFNIYNGAQKDV
ncbi:MAG TPA: hypothetical protein PK033_09885 [Acetivibrio sp.]|nr:hypothetical protein [Clostridium sp.]HOQ38484.1 hypothetical protein [Acetivibrio sp.]HPT92054.1 hypothetical protein [Acetivibrio sp.]HQA58170.1 hypothetical protein [Acetivibrio sp.]